MSKTALIIGIGGQDGSYLAEILLNKGYSVHGIYRRSSVNNLWRIEGIRDRLTLHIGDLCDTNSIVRTINYVRPDEVYNLADQDDVRCSHHSAGYNYDVTGAAVGRLLESFVGRDRFTSSGEKCRFFQAISATIFGNPTEPQNLNTPLNPLSPYACAKAFALHLCRYYRQVHNMWISTAIFYNHDSPRRGGGYLLQKIGRGLVQVAAGKIEHIRLYNPNERVNIGHAKSYMDAASRMLQNPYPADLLIGNTCDAKIARLAYYAMGYLGLDDNAVLWEGGPTTPYLSPDKSACTSAEIAVCWNGGRIKLPQAEEVLVEIIEDEAAKLGVEL